MSRGPAILDVLHGLLTDTPVAARTPLEECYRVRADDGSPLSQAIWAWRADGFARVGTSASRVVQALVAEPQRYGIDPMSEAPLDRLVWQEIRRRGGL